MQTGELSDLISTLVTNGFHIHGVDRLSPENTIINTYKFDLYGCGLADVEVGVIDFMTGEHYQTSFGKREIDNAINELNVIGQMIADNT